MGILEIGVVFRLGQLSVDGNEFTLPDLESELL